MSTAREAGRRIWRRMERFWSRLREWCGDAAYERYLRTNGKGSGANNTLSAKEFYLEQTNRRYSQPNRCC
jgi:uncharacterized short protein YbdD (DUF466 family)